MHLCSIALAQEPSRGTALTAIRPSGPRTVLSASAPISDSKSGAILPSCETALERLRDDGARGQNSPREELSYLSGPLEMEMAIEQLMGRYPIQLLLVTLGGDGVLAHDGQHLHHLAARNHSVVDTTGAGDAFVAGLLAGLAEYSQLPS